jgi:tRNA pseudouridine32 synthase / 23S rRNA pseudouridine746 synthase
VFEPHIPFDATVLYRDERLLVVDKPHFLPMAPTGRYARETLLARLQLQLGLDDLVPLHRLDRDTAGVVMFCLQPQARAAYQNLFRDRLVHKTYEALAPWRPELAEVLRQGLERRSRLQTSPAHFMQVIEVDGEPNAITRISVIAHHGAWAHYRLEPLTGHKHQLRVHMSALGLPLLGDRYYPVMQAERKALDDMADDFSQPLQLLAREIRFEDPFSGQARCFASPARLKLPD